MENIFNPNERKTILNRIEKLQAGASRQWGTMTSAQMLTHCSLALKSTIGEYEIKKVMPAFIGQFFKKTVLGSKPFGKATVPTAKELKVKDDKDFMKEKQELINTLNRFTESNIKKHEHHVIGKMNANDWGRLMYKHIDHHLKQFGA